MPLLRIVLSVAILTLISIAGAHSVGPLPALGPLLDPVRGVWSVAATARLPAHADGVVPGLGDSVRVVYDDRGVPHIFATSEEDAARALGYVVARDRLFQLELQTRAAAGTLSGLVGEVALPLDQEVRRLGLAWSAGREFTALDPDDAAHRLMVAYADGVNAWIARAGQRGRPLEYRLLGARPMRWEPVHSLYMVRRMGYTLTYLTPEFRRDRVVALVGEAAADALFPRHDPLPEPIVPPREPDPRLDRTRLPPPAPPRPSPAAAPAPRRRAAASNNWVVAPARTAAGHAILSGDPHLELTLPSVWYEAQVTVPGVLDVYGVTIPGSPAIIIGFNRDVAWSMTNTGADVLDAYAEEFDRPEQPTAYRLDGAWRPLERRVEEYRGPDGRVLAVDTVYHTHRGPVLWHDGRPYSIRWTVLEATGTGDAIYRAAKTTSVDAWLRAMEGYEAPAQNAAVADRGGNIAIQSAAWYPIRPGDGRGDVIFDGTTSASDWVGRWPVERHPRSVNPSQGFLASANQEPLASAAYLGSDWPTPWRAMRINQLLRANPAVTPEDMRRYQLDPGNVRADRFVPYFLEAAARPVAATDGVADRATDAARLLAEWDRRYTRDNTRAVLFELAMSELGRRVWDELLPPDTGGGDRPDGPAGWPSETVLWVALHDASSPWWDDRRTPQRVEDRDQILVASLAAALDTAEARYGSPSSAGWRWDRIRHTNIHHLLRLRSLSALDLPVQGGRGTLNPSSGSGVWGASWRMVVELGPELRARTVYPGGQSGNPVSPYYDDRIERWMEGELDDARFPRTPDELPPTRVLSTLLLASER